ELLIENVELLPEAFDYLQLPVSLKQGRVGRLSITVPWSMLGQIVISLENVYICVGQRDDDEWNLESVKRREYEGKKAKLHAAEFEKLSKRVSGEGSRTGQAFISYITAKILDRIQVSIKDVHFVYAGQQSDSARRCRDDEIERGRDGEAVACDRWGVRRVKVEGDDSEEFDYVDLDLTRNEESMAEFAIGLLFSSLTMKQNSFGLPCGKPRGAQVNKIVEILGLEIYCNASPGVLHLSASEDGVNSQFFDEARLESSKLDSVLDPCDVVVSLAVNKSGMLEDGVPQYSISVNKSEKPKDRDDCVPEYPTLNLKLNEIQMHKILIQWDYLGSCQLREKYGRYRPCSGTLCSKSEGWQKMWWKYAQESILSDIRESSRKTSWRYLGWRMAHEIWPPYLPSLYVSVWVGAYGDIPNNPSGISFISLLVGSYRRKYVNLYKTKLSFIRQNQPVDKDTLLELEQMEKESDINDILIFRSIAECESEDSLLSSTLSNVGRYSGSVTTGNQQNDEGSSARARGWINWLSLGMLGAGGTENSVQFSGVVSDEIVKNIHDVTEFNPMSSDGGAGLTRNGVFLFSIKLKLHQLNVTLKASSKGAIKLTLDDMDMAFKLWEESWNILMLVNSVQMDDPCTNKVMLLSKKDSFEENILTQEQPFINFEVDMPSVSIESEASVKVLLIPADFLANDS
ncbi:hypothetical protein IFM89_004545, partial [Coptis chinensis]